MSEVDDIAEFEHYIRCHLSEFNKTPNWDGFIGSLPEKTIDEICHAYIKNVPSTLDDIVPAICDDQMAFIDNLYALSHVMEELKTDIFLYLETAIQRSIDEQMVYEGYTKPEPFAGYEVGQ